MKVFVELSGFGKADHCEISTMASHYPPPLRFVWHHIQPQEAGGATVATNLAQLCDSCHYAIHDVMHALAKELPVPRAHRDQLKLAREGYEACVAAGTVGKIPNEGGVSGG